MTIDETLGQIQVLLDDFEDDGTKLCIELTPQSVCPIVRVENGQTSEGQVFCEPGNLIDSPIQQAISWLQH